MSRPASIVYESCRCAPAIVLLAEAAARAQPGPALRIPVLCALLDVSRRSLERVFQRAVGMGPGAYMRRCALTVAGRSLQRAQPVPGAITRIAMESGFPHLGRFAAVYRRQFGERPIDTLRRRQV